jgi:hypothetical protein
MVDEGAYAERPLDMHLDVPVRGPGGKYSDFTPYHITSKADILTVRRVLATELASLREDEAMNAAATGYVDQVLLLVKKARATRQWIDELDAAMDAPPAPPQPVVAPATIPSCADCGKAGYAQDDAGTWWCKRHAHERGLLQPPVVKDDAPLCDFCEQRPARRRYDDLHYCGPCAEAARLPADAEEVTA